MHKEINEFDVYGWLVRNPGNWIARYTGSTATLDPSLRATREYIVDRLVGEEGGLKEDEVPVGMLWLQSFSHSDAEMAQRETQFALEMTRQGFPISQREARLAGNCHVIAQYGSLVYGWDRAAAFAAARSIIKGIPRADALP